MTGKELFLGLLEWVARSNLFISLAAAFACWTSFLFLNAPVDFGLIGLILAGTFSVYNGQRVISDFSYHRTVKVQKVIYVFIGFIACIPLLFLLTLSQIVVLGISAVLALGYATPIPFNRTKPFALRELPYLKIWIIVLVWVLTTVLVPFLSDPNISKAPVLVLWIFAQGSFIFALTIPFDIRDLERDTLNQKTIPMIFGREKAIRLALGAIGVALLLVSIAAILEYISLFMFLAQILVYLGSALAILKGKDKRREMYYLIVLDGFIILQGLLSVLSQQM
jgi:4-hydroxybenzoate polyprenyltransferase